MSIRIRQICLVANQLAPIIEDMKAVLGLEVCFKDKAVKVFGLENSLFPVGNNFIEVVAPIQENTAAGRYLKRRNGDGGFIVSSLPDSGILRAAILREQTNSLDPILRPAPDKIDARE